MEAELVALATAGATALVQQMVGDGWERARTRIATFFAARSGADEEAVGAELESARDELLRAARDGDSEAVDEATSEARVEWRARMRRSLLADPRSAGELRRILADLAHDEQSAAPPPLTVSNAINGGVQHGVVIQTGTIGHLRIGDQPGPAGPDGQDGTRP
ncbi:hypothetical protein ACIGEZ_00925 [Streptomyces sp. NPDC085481]|uniref:hypothetical protein n=1 Tax=Streptomyces sp. NPDC085481 TaxID=3365727 RepID=UPI0037CCD962